MEEEEITKQQFSEIKNKLHQFCFTSLKYTNFEEITDYELLINDNKAIIIYGYDCAAIGEIKQEVIGVICVGIYGTGDKITLWVREVAVEPEFQGKGIAKKLIGQAFAYGMKHGAKKAFLMANECNDNAIHLYRSMGFKASIDECQIDMIR